MLHGDIRPKRLELLVKPLLPGLELVSAALDIPDELQAIRCRAVEIGLHANTTAEDHRQGKQHCGD
jgi:hypothetical protein